MDEKYKKAIKAGLIGAAFTVIVHLITDLVFYWSMTRPAVQELANQYGGGTPPVPTGFANISPDVLIGGFAIVAGAMLAFAAYLLAGALAAYYIAPSVRGTGMGNVATQNAIVGAIAAAVTQAAGTPFTLFFVLLMTLFPAYGPPETWADILGWLGSQLVAQYVVFMAVAIVLGAIAALACGIAARALCRSNATA